MFFLFGFLLLTYSFNSDFSTLPKDTIISFTEKGFDYTLELKSEQKRSKITLKKFSGLQYISASVWLTPYPVFKIFIADANNDGKAEIAMGVIKKTRFDRNNSKRAFFFKISDGQIRPLWLSSKLKQELIDFKAVKENNIVFIKTIEKNKNNRFFIGKYFWDGFGLKFSLYLKRNISEKQALEIY